MEGHPNFAFSDPNDSEILNVKPLRSLAPMLPPQLGQKDTFSPPNAPPFVCVTPFGSFNSESGYLPGFCPLFPTHAAPQNIDQRPVDPSSRTAVNGFTHASDGSHTGTSLHDTPPFPFFQTPPVMATPLNKENPFLSGVHSPSGIKRPLHLNSNYVGSSETEGSSKKKGRPRKPRRTDDKDLLLLPSSHDPRESVEVVLMTFDALRRRIMQLDEAKKLRPDLKAGTIMLSNDLRANSVKRVGHVPGVDVGDMFYFRIELCVVGLHSQSISGIDYMTARFGTEDDPVAVGIVSAGVYDNDEGDVNTLIYIGQGSSGKDDQKLERGNLALERSLRRANEIRVIRSAKDPTIVNGKIYIYDGLYKIRESWLDKGKSGFNVFKYKLLREPGQRDGIAVWKNTEKWKENPSSRGNVILPDISSGVENIPVCVVNEVDAEKGPSHFIYTTRVSYSKPVTSSEPTHGCMCNSVCLPGDLNCSCLQRSGGYFPYSSNGILFSRKPIIYECSSLCRCSLNCRNRLTQRGIQLHFEVFKTKDRGWGLCCWDPIRAGSFICEYTGLVIENTKVIEDSEEDEYIIQSTYADQTFNWNYVPELLGEPSYVDSNETSKQLPFVISAKKMGNISRFMNHSCSPNVFWQPVSHDHNDDAYAHVMFFAIKHIPPMTELTYDYGLSQATISEGWMGDRVWSPRTKKCLCGSVKCRGLFG